MLLPLENNAIALTTTCCHPAVLDQYRLLRRLGWGGAGVVCEAEDTSLGQRVAIKLIPHDHSAGLLRRALLEARLAATVRHPHVVALRDAGAYPGGVYLVMELVEGGPVGSLLAGVPLPWREATEIAVSACEGLIAVHAHGIVHCDVKPANLLRTADGNVKLTDFGLACWLDPSRRPAGWRRLAGTPHYMSPEQCREEECDERTDVYSLGATYYTLLTGKTPYAESSPLKIMFEHCSAPVPDPRSEQPEVPRACAEIVLRAMAKKRADRFGTARALQEALRSVLHGRPTPWRNRGNPAPV